MPKQAYIDDPPEFVDSIEDEAGVILDVDLSQMDLIGKSIDDYTSQYKDAQPVSYDFAKKKVSIKLNLEQMRRQQENMYGAKSQRDSPTGQKN